MNDKNTVAKNDLNEEPRYKGVCKVVKQKRYVYWNARHTYEGEKWQVTMKTQRDAALAYDKRLISLGLEPVNILRRAAKPAA